MTDSWAINFVVLAARRADMDLVYSAGTLLVSFLYCTTFWERGRGVGECGEGGWGGGCGRF